MSEAKVQEFFVVGSSDGPLAPLTANTRAEAEKLLTANNPILWQFKPVAELKVKLQPVRKPMVNKPGRKKKEKDEAATPTPVSKL